MGMRFTRLALNKAQNWVKQYGGCVDYCEHTNPDNLAAQDEIYGYAEDDSCGPVVRAIYCKECAEAVHADLMEQKFEDEREGAESAAVSPDEGLEKAMAAEDWPLLVYIYDSKGYYREPIVVRSKEQLEPIFKNQVRQALAEQREVRITDSGDIMVFHAQYGLILFPRPEFATLAS